MSRILKKNLFTTLPTFSRTEIFCSKADTCSLRVAGMFDGSGSGCTRTMRDCCRLAPLAAEATAGGDVASALTTSAELRRLDELSSEPHGRRSVRAEGLKQARPFILPAPPVPPTVRSPEELLTLLQTRTAAARTRCRDRQPMATTPNPSRPRAPGSGTFTAPVPKTLSPGKLACPFRRQPAQAPRRSTPPKRRAADADAGGPGGAFDRLEAQEEV